ncbi:MAG: hypothetical protein RL514_4047 [Verrucomicrobiota bacterium]|jgi:uncharacterized protein (DUF1499 family)
MMPAPAKPSLRQRIALRLARVALIGFAVAALLAMFDGVPTNLGLTSGKLAPCPDSPNCVSSTATDPRHAIAGFALEHSLGAAKEELKGAVAKLPRAKLISETDNYLHFEFRSLIFRFVDDVEFHLVDATKTIHVRSASRVGYSDFGVNRRRVEAIRAGLPEAMRSTR